MRRRVPGGLHLRGRPDALYPSGRVRGLRSLRARLPGHVPAEWKNYTPINAEFFSESISGIGSPGGAAQVGPVDKDHPFVAAFAAPE